jgi:signal transduction histidine kinase/Tfp pilus assembly protein PilF
MKSLFILIVTFIWLFSPALNAINPTETNSLPINKTAGGNRFHLQKHTQNIMDSLDRIIKTIPGYSKKTEILLNYLSNTNDTFYSDAIFNKALKIANLSTNKDEIYSVYNRYGVIQRNHALYIEALEYHKKALALANKANNLSHKAQSLNNIGVVYRRVDDNKQAMEYHLQALKIAEQINDSKQICISLNSIGNIDLCLEKYTDALPYLNRALLLEKERGNPLGVAINLNNIGYLYEKTNHYDQALNYYQQSLDYNLKLKDSNGVAICYNSIGNVYLQKSDNHKAIMYYNKALKIHETIGDRIYISTCYLDIANAYFQEGQTFLAIDCNKKGLKIALEIGSKSEVQAAYKGLSECYEKNKEFEKALFSHKQSVLYADSILNESSLMHISLMQTKYNNEYKQHQIELLQKSNENARLYMIIILVVGFVIIIIISLINKGIRQKRKIDQQELDLKEQKIKELEKDQQLLATKLVLQGEEAERTRLARDLHDGLGGLLSGVKLALNSFKGNFIVSNDNVTKFDKALNLLDSSIKEMRRISHNMMPETLVKFGLKEALADFCSRLTNKDTQISFSFFGAYTKLDQLLESNIYRIAQELLNNAQKHSRADEIIIQLVQEPHRIHLTVQDNGTGFQPNNVDPLKSTGLQSIKARVESFGGRIDINSKPEQGTEIGVEFIIE